MPRLLVIHAPCSSNRHKDQSLPCPKSYLAIVHVLADASQLTFLHWKWPCSYPGPPLLCSGCLFPTIHVPAEVMLVPRNSRFPISREFPGKKNPDSREKLYFLPGKSGIIILYLNTHGFKRYLTFWTKEIFLRARSCSN